MVEREHAAEQPADDERHEAVAVDMAAPTEAADDGTSRRLMALGRGAQDDFDEALVELSAAPRRLSPQPDRGLSVERAMRCTMQEHRGVFAALAKSERQDREAEVGHANIRKGLAS